MGTERKGLAVRSEIESASAPDEDLVPVPNQSLTANRFSPYAPRQQLA